LADDPNRTTAVQGKKIKNKQLKEKWSQKYKNSINCSNPKGFSQKAHCQGKKKQNESKQEQCPHCGGAMYNIDIINEKKDSCYYKVKSRYKVWPSAYASGALVKCRKKGAKNWGNKSESIEQINEVGAIGQAAGIMTGLLGAAVANQALRRQAEKKEIENLKAEREQRLKQAEQEQLRSTTPDHSGAAVPKETDDARKQYFAIPESLSYNARESFGFRHDNKGWYLREGQENFRQLYLNAIKAFPLK
jgi:hypothetical protein